ncbi:MAG: twin-arginine translocase subunit TatC [Cytophagaceae bacterium]|nr:twin-arginine translocase subunit TatC [Cytophagaceae bacterium]MDW8456840.1 twin-arginine translocase subunit TatC [Cytophagaceae bacterium]
MRLDQEDKEGGKEMSFLEHLEELRIRLIRSFIAVAVFTIVAFVYMDVLFESVILAPSRTDFWTYKMLCKISENTCVENIDIRFQNRVLTGQFMMHIVSSLVLGLIVAFPYVFMQLWKFVKPALSRKERRSVRGTVFFVALLFFLGVLFGYYVLSPLSINFLANYSIHKDIPNIIDITNYVTTVAMMVLACGIVFQLPIVILLLTKVGILSSSIMKRYRRHAVVILLIFAAILTPSPDLFSQLIVAMPMYLLFELSILLAVRTERKEQQRN